MNELSARLRAALWWLVPLVALVALIGWETDWGRGLERPPPALDAVTPKPVVVAALPEYEIAGGVAARTETVQRTLFNPTRRPAPPVAQEGAAAKLQRGQFALTGTMLVDGKSTAFLRELAGNRSRRVQQGESINGLLVAEVKPDRVKFTLGDESEELVLRVAGNPRPTVQPVVAAPGVPPPGAPQTAAAAAQPVPPGMPENPTSLAERRRAARAAQVAAGGAAAPVEGTAAPALPVPITVPPVTPANAAAAAAPTTPDPRWQEVYRRYQQQQR